MNSKPKSFASYLDYFFVLRPMLFYPGWITLLAGYLIADKKEIYFNVNKIIQIDYSEIGLLLLMFAASMGASFLLNQLKDIESDLHNNKLFIVSKGYLTKKNVKLEIIVLIIISMIISFYISVNIVVLNLLFILLTGYMYNFKPFVLKDKPFGSLIANALMGALAFALGWASTNMLGWEIIVDVLPYLFLNTALYFYTTLPDIKGDQETKKNTIAVLYGLKFTIRLAFILYLLGLVCAIVLKDFTALLILIVLVPFFINTIRNYSTESTVRTTKYSILVFAVVICFKIPFFFILMLSGFYATRWYFKTRFNYDYPNFKG